MTLRSTDLPGPQAMQLCGDLESGAATLELLINGERFVIPPDNVIAFMNLMTTAHSERERRTFETDGDRR